MSETMKKTKRFVTIQCASQMDGMDDQGHPRYQTPYPYHIDADGRVGQQDFWQGKLLVCHGFQRSFRTQQVDVWWSEVFAEPQKAVGLYPVFTDKDGDMFAMQTGVESVSTIDLPVDF